MINTDVLRWRLEELASREEQERLWLGHSTNEMSSFEEAMCGVFDDAGLTRAIDSGALAQTCSPEFCRKLNEIHRRTRAIPANSKPRDVIDHREMERVRKLAAELLEMLPNEGLQ